VAGTEEGMVADPGFLLLIIGFFVACAGYVWALERL
jgi:hypothetical protein